MKAKHLIAILQQYSPEAEIMIEKGYVSCSEYSYDHVIMNRCDLSPDYMHTPETSSKIYIGVSR